jgi:glycosyltransferase involved in cell wall biosynthesis
LLAELKAKYQAAQVGVFASSCETFGIILLEEMAMGLPLACANRSAMPEIAKDSVVYFDPESTPSLVHALDALIHSPELRLANRTAALQLAREYTWQTSAKETFTFLREVAQHHLPS